ncbi:uncharacterized protein LOC124196842 isoform X2 [Daphnia pulex]|uniref:uncharacterized protein LOC124196842 isoform X2 n=1 Tax=Daphnia pulex TaxID=6669 RepID=UPI001EDE0489|nr:uncharacterized protein LOC124196842 isoform X2 [Daphnia pulex]
MTKLSLVVFVWIWHCAVYGQLPLNNVDYNPYTSTFLSQPTKQIRAARATGRLGNPQNIRDALSLSAISLQLNKQIEATTASLASQLKDTNDKLEKTNADLSSTQKQVSDLMEALTKANDATKAAQADLDKTNSALSQWSAALKAKASKEELYGAVSHFTAALDEKAFKEEMDHAVGQLTTALDEKVSKEKFHGTVAQLTAALDAKASKGELVGTVAQLTKALDAKASNEELVDAEEQLNAALDTKASKEDLEEAVEQLTTALDAKALKEELDSAVAKFTTNGTAALNTKASKSDLEATNLEVSKLKVLTSPNSNGAIPTSCGDLKTFGFAKSGIYSVMISKQVQNVYCDFSKSNDAGLQKWIGIVDVKSAPVYFQAQRTSSYSTVDSVVPFDLIRLNDGKALDPSGVFVAPAPGKYFFGFSGLSDNGALARVVLEVKTATVDWSRVGEGYGDTTFKTFAFHATLELLKGDQVRLVLTEGAIHDSDLHFYTNFVGVLIAQNELTV